MKLTTQQAKKLLMQAAILCGLLIMPVVYALASPRSPGGDPGGAPAAPIDGGISLLVAAGIGYGIKKAHDRKNTAKTGSNEK